MARLYELKNIIGVKDATGDLNRVDETLKKLGKDFLQLTGNDDNALEFNKRGGKELKALPILLLKFVQIFKIFLI